MAPLVSIGVKYHQHSYSKTSMRTLLLSLEISNGIVLFQSKWFNKQYIYIYIYNISIHNPKFIFLFKLYTIYAIIYLIAVVFSNCLWICIDSRAICCWWRGSFLVNSCPIICLLYFSIFLSRMVELSILIVYFLVSCDSPQISPFCSQLMNDQYCDVSVWRRVDRLKDDVLGDC